MVIEALDEQVRIIANDIWEGMLGADPTTPLTFLPEPAGPDFLGTGEIVDARVDLEGEWTGSCVISTARETADALCRSLLMLDANDPVSDEDIVDAIGEVANVVGGNVKALLPNQGKMSLPSVTNGEVAKPIGRMVSQVDLLWGDRPISITVWATGSSADF